MDKTSNSEIQFSPQTVLKGTLKGKELNIRRIPEYGKLKMPSSLSTNNWIQKDTKYKISKWNINKIFIPSERTMEFENNAFVQKSMEQ
jgi:hypothetical protein